MAYGVSGGRAAEFRRDSAPPDRGGVEMREAAQQIMQQAAGQQEVNRLEQANAALQALSRQEARASEMPAQLGNIANFNVRNMARQIAAGGTPYYGPRGVANVMHPGFFGGTVMSGMPTSAHDAYMADVRSGQYAPTQYGMPQPVSEEVAPTAPMPAPVQPNPYTYYMAGLLDQAPTGLLEFSQRYGVPTTDFAAANRQFRQEAGYRPSYFTNPRPTTGYTLLG